MSTSPVLLVAFNRPDRLQGLIDRLREVRPISRLWASNGTTSGSPGEGHGSSLCCSAYQSGSTQTSATHSNSTAGAVDGGTEAAAAGCAGGVPRSRAFAGAACRGIVPVVKS